ncbi:class I SAM-dependent methyltransferase [Curvivirga aplysinae]|uniref:class I SAM-dependent methyltransferase n=1 Tax=Curvivirga aplysinae TaxID=2529852 RepID=UPI002E26690E
MDYDYYHDDQDALRQLIRENTNLESPRLLPEILLHLAVEDLPLWRMGEMELQEIGLGTPFWAFAWAGGQALSRHILDNPSLVAGKRVLDFGSGSGMVAMAATMAGAFEVTATDIDPVAAIAMQMNAEENNCYFDISTDDVVGDYGDWDVILVGDVCYDADIARAVIPWIKSLAQDGRDVLIGDPGRFYLPKLGLKKIAKYASETTSLMEDTDLRNAQVWSIDLEKIGCSSNAEDY